MRFTDYRVGDLVLVREPDGTTFEGLVSRVGQPWGMTVATSYGRNVPVAFSHVLMLEPDPSSPIIERWASNGRPVRLEPDLKCPSAAGTRGGAAPDTEARPHGQGQPAPTLPERTA